LVNYKKKKKKKRIIQKKQKIVFDFLYEVV